MSTVYFYCDESGAKGYADKPESKPGEVGVFAGILVPDSKLDAAKPVFDAIALKYTPASGKLHIADLPPPQQEALRSELYMAIRQFNLPCFWYAIHVQGLHRGHLDEQRRLQEALEAKRAARGGVEPRFKQGSLRDQPASMHVQLFEGLYAHVVAYLLECEQSGVQVDIRTDQVDTPVVKQFREVAEDLLNMDPMLVTSKGFDTLAKVVVERELEIKVQWPPELDFGPLVSSLNIKTVPDSDGLVLAADVLANSLNYLFSRRTGDELYTELNRPDAIEEHPLVDHLCAFRDWGAGDVIGDMLLRHPLAKN